MYTLKMAVLLAILPIFAHGKDDSFATMVQEENASNQEWAQELTGMVNILLGAYEGASKQIKEQGKTPPISDEQAKALKNKGDEAILRLQTITQQLQNKDFQAAAQTLDAWKAQTGIDIIQFAPISEAVNKSYQQWQKKYPNTSWDNASPLQVQEFLSLLHTQLDQKESNNLAQVAAVLASMVGAVDEVKQSLAQEPSSQTAALSFPHLLRDLKLRVAEHVIGQENPKADQILLNQWQHFVQTVDIRSISDTDYQAVQRLLPYMGREFKDVRLKWNALEGARDE